MPTSPSSSTSKSSRQPKLNKLSTYTPKTLLTRLLHDDTIDDNQFRKLAILSGAQFIDLFEMNDETKEAIPRTKRQLLVHLQHMEEQKVIWVTPALMLGGMGAAVGWYLNASAVNKTLKNGAGQVMKGAQEGAKKVTKWTKDTVDAGVNQGITQASRVYRALTKKKKMNNGGETTGDDVHANNLKTIGGVVGGPTQTAWNAWTWSLFHTSPLQMIFNSATSLGGTWITTNILRNFVEGAPRRIIDGFQEVLYGNWRGPDARTANAKRGILAIIVLYFLQGALSYIFAPVKATTDFFGNWWRDEANRKTIRIKAAEEQKLHQKKQQFELEKELKVQQAQQDATQKEIQLKQSIQRDELNFKEKQHREKLELEKLKIEGDAKIKEVLAQQELLTLQLNQTKYEDESKEKKEKKDEQRTLQLRRTERYNNFINQLKRFQTALYVLPATATIVMLYYKMCQRRTKEAVFHVLHNNYRKAIPYKPYNGKALRNIDYTLHKMFLASAKKDESVDALRYRIIQYHHSTFGSRFGSKTRLIMLNHLVEPTGHLRDSPDQIASAIVKYQSTFTDVLSGRMFTRVARNTLRTLGNVTGLRRRSSSHSWLKTKTKRNPTKARSSSSHRKTSKKTSSRSGSRRRTKTTRTRKP